MIFMAIGDILRTHAHTYASVYKREKHSRTHTHAQTEVRYVCVCVLQLTILLLLMCWWVREGNGSVGNVWPELFHAHARTQPDVGVTPGVKGWRRVHTELPRHPG